MQEIEDNFAESSAKAVPLTLNPWKEIASYLGRAVRTVQRWESGLEFPVHRTGNGERDPVYAVISEVNFWMMTSDRRCAKTVARPAEEPRDLSAWHHYTHLRTRLHQLAQTAAESSVRHQLQVAALERNILALRSTFSLRKSK